MNGKRTIIGQPITFGAAPDIYALRTLAKSDPQGFVRKTQDLIEKREITLDKIRNWPALYAALADVQVPVTLPVGETQRAIMASAFPVLTGSTVVAAINDAYNSVETVGQDLVTEMDDAKAVTTIGAVHALDNNVEEVPETDDFPEIGATEEYYEIREKRNGRRVSISQDMIDRNDVANIVARVNAVGELAANRIEVQTLKRICDYNGSAASAAEPYVLRLNGTATPLYSASANTPGARAPSGTCIQNNAFTDETDLDAVRTRLATMLDASGTRISIPRSEVAILCPDAVVSNVLKVLSSEYVPGVENELSMWGPRGKWNIPIERVYSTPKLDDLSSTAWYYGAFRKQFRRKWAIRMEYVTLGTDTESYLRSRIAFQARVAWNCEVGAVDYVYVVQNLTATAFPIDE